MLRHGCCLFIGVLVLAEVVVADEPGSKSNVQKQRVSPKLLREALALPEFAQRIQEVPPVSLDDLKRLADKLKSKGDTEDAELLTRYVYEHERVTMRAQAYPGAEDEMFNIQCEVLEVNFGDLPAKYNVAARNCKLLTNEFQAELHRLVKSKKADVVIERVQIPIKAYETAHARSGKDLPIQIPSSDGTVSVDIREIGTIVETSAIPMTKERVRLQIMTETSATDSENSTTILGTPVPGITKSRIQSTIEADLGETVVQSSGPHVIGRHQLVLVKVVKGTSKK